ncbi:MAG: acyltransferase [bacterium]
MSEIPKVLTHQKYAYFPSLDILRFLAFMLVFVSHASLFFGYQNNSPKWNEFREVFLAHGDLGVTFFFVLSGFLITYLLMSEKNKKGEINIKKFYMRRLLRIWPVYFFTLIIAVGVLPYFVKLIGVGNSMPFDIFSGLHNYPWYVFFIGNFNMFLNTPPSVTLAVLWSISVEEQFYLLWSLIIKNIKQKYIPLILTGVIIVSTVYRFVYANDYNTVKYSTFSVMSDIAIGCGVAWLFFEKSRLTTWARNLSHAKAFFLYYSSLCILILSRSSIYDVQIEWLKKLLISVEPLIFAVLFAFIIARLAGLRDSFITGRHPIQKMFVYLGRISYGLYCYHMIVLVLVLTMFYQGGYQIIYSSTTQLIVIFGATLVITVILAMVSYHFIERNILKLKKNFN